MRSNFEITVQYFGFIIVMVSLYLVQKLCQVSVCFCQTTNHSTLLLRQIGPLLIDIEEDKFPNFEVQGFGKINSFTFLGNHKV